MTAAPFDARNGGAVVHHDVVIVGGGLVGASLAIALEPTGLDVALLEATAAGSLPAVFDERNLSFADATVNALTALGVLENLRTPGASIRRIHVSRAGDFGRVRLDAAAYGRDAFGQVVIARADALETLARVTHVVFDKTGTLTMGRVTVTGIYPQRATTCKTTRESALELAAALNAHSEHPLARAFRAAASEVAVLPRVSDVTIVAGNGVEGSVDGRRVRLGRIEFVAALSGYPVPRGNVQADATMTQVGTSKLSALRLPWATRASVMMPIVFWASFVPWASASRPPDATWPSLKPRVTGPGRTRPTIR